MKIKEERNGIQVADVLRHSPLRHVSRLTLWGHLVVGPTNHFRYCCVGGDGLWSPEVPAQWQKYDFANLGDGNCITLNYRLGKITVHLAPESSGTLWLCHAASPSSS